VVVTDFVMGELHDPTIEIAAVEDRLPVARRRGAPVGRGDKRQDRQRQDRDEGSHRRTGYRKNHQTGTRGGFYAGVVVPATVTGQALWFIESHLAEDLPLDRIAATVGVSTFHLCRAFAAATGQSVAA